MNTPTEFRKIALVYQSLDNNRTAKYISELASLISQQLVCTHGDTIAFHQCSPLSLEQYDGVIGIQLALHQLQTLKTHCTHLVSINDHHFESLEIPQISWDHTAIGHLCAEFFLDTGLKNFAYVQSEPPVATESCLKGFQEAVQLTGGNVHLFEFKSGDSSSISPLFFQENNSKPFIEWISSLPKPAALLITQETIAHQFVYFCRSNDIQVPEEIRLLSVGNDEMICGLSDPAISSVELDYRNAARLAMKTLNFIIGTEQPLQLQKLHRSLEPIEIMQRRSTDASAVNNVHVSRAVELIHECATSGITVDEISSQLNVSRSYLERSFRQQIGRSPGSEIRRTKLTLVKQLLQNTRLTISEIAERTGFPHQEYLYVAFKRQYRMTPLQYRKRISNKTHKSSLKLCPTSSRSHPVERSTLACA